MDDSDLLAFTPVPLRARRGGWTPKKQYFFILGLARGFTPARAAGILGLTRKTAYDLRGKPGGEGFAAAWDAAVARARGRRIEAQAASLIERGLHGEWVPRRYRGRVVGWTHKETNVGLMRVLNSLDKMTARLPPGAGMIDFEHLLESIVPKGDSSNAISPTEPQFCHVPPPDSLFPHGRTRASANKALPLSVRSTPPVALRVGADHEAAKRKRRRSHGENRNLRGDGAHGAGDCRGDRCS